MSEKTRVRIDVTNPDHLGKLSPAVRCWVDAARELWRDSEEQDQALMCTTPVQDWPNRILSRIDERSEELKRERGLYGPEAGR